MGLSSYTRVWTHSNMDGRAKTLLLALADRAGDDGVAHPGIWELVERTKTDKRTVQRLIKDCCEAGELYYRPGDGRKHPSAYLLAPGFNVETITSILTSHWRFKLPLMFAHEEATRMVEAMKKNRAAWLETFERIKEADRRGKKRKRVTRVPPFPAVENLSEEGEKGDTGTTLFPVEKLERVTNQAEKGDKSCTERVTNRAEKGDIFDAKSDLTSNPSTEAGSGQSWDSHEGQSWDSHAAAPPVTSHERISIQEGIALLRGTKFQYQPKVSFSSRYTLDDTDGGQWSRKEIFACYIRLTSNEVGGSDRSVIDELEVRMDGSNLPQLSSGAVCEVMNRISKRAARRARGTPEKIHSLAYFKKGIFEVLERCQKRIRATNELLVGSGENVERWLKLLNAVRNEVDEWESEGNA